MLDDDFKKHNEAISVANENLFRFFQRMTCGYSGMTDYQAELLLLQLDAVKELAEKSKEAISKLYK